MSGTPSDESDSNFYDIVSQDNIYNFESIYPNPESSLLSKQLEDRLLNKLNDKERKVVVMKLKEDLTYQEIGERMGYTKQGIGQIFKKIEEKYKEYFYNIAEVTT
jgi:RNA polymerase sigma factor (sigma-70 family)